MNFTIYAPTYKRANLCLTHKYLKNVIYVVRESEAKDYEGIHDKIWVVPDTAQGNLSRIRNYVLNNAEGKNILLLDDDISNFNRWNGNQSKKLDEQEAYNMIQEGYLLADDLDVVFWGLNCISDKGSYMENTPFGTRSYIGGPFQAHRNNTLRYDERIFLKEDLDMSLQVLNKYRKNLRLNMYNYDCNQANLKGGCADYRNHDIEKEHNEMLKNKWGSKIVKMDTGNSQVNRIKTIIHDINPIIKIPIKGV